MTQRPFILSITGSDNSGESGIQADIKTITALEGEALTAVTTVTIQTNDSIQSITDLPKHLIIGQVKAAIDSFHPVAVKIGMVREAETIRALRDEVVGARKLILAPGVLCSCGRELLNDDAIAAWMTSLIPLATILILRQNEAQMLLKREITTSDDMLEAARSFIALGAQSVFIKGGKTVEGRLTALLLTENGHQSFSSQNVAGWQRHGVGAAFSSAVATRLAMADSVEDAIKNAHEYMHSQVVYAVERNSYSYKPSDIFNNFMNAIADHHTEAHDVAFYADQLNISTHYLNNVTRRVVLKSPKEIISGYLLNEAYTLLRTSRLGIAQVAERLGFSSLPAFSKWFTSLAGLSPVAYRKSIG